jgi:hypothetical protein
MKALLYFSIFILILSCSTKKSSSNDVLENDTVSVIKFGLNEISKREKWERTFENQPLRIMKAKSFKKEYDFVVNGQNVIYPKVDSCSSNLFDWKKPKFYVLININDMSVKNIAKCSFTFKCIGSGVKFTAKKENNTWKIIEYSSVKF